MPPGSQRRWQRSRGVQAVPVPLSRAWTALVSLPPPVTPRHRLQLLAGPRGAFSTKRSDLPAAIALSEQPDLLRQTKPAALKAFPLDALPSVRRALAMRR